MSKINISKLIEVYFDDKLGTYVIEFKNDSTGRTGRYIISDDIVGPPVLIPIEEQE